MAFETNFLKDYFGTLPQKTDVDSIMAKDANGNPVWIKKADLAAVAAELMPVATAEKNGTMSADFYNRGIRGCLILSSPNNGKLVEIGSLLNKNYYRAFLKVEGFYETSPIMCTFNINVLVTGPDIVINKILPGPTNIKFYKKITDEKISLYAMSTGQGGNETQIVVTHYGSRFLSDIGSVYDLDNTCTEIE